MLVYINLPQSFNFTGCIIRNTIKKLIGGVAEWLKAADCKSARIAYVGSNPTPTTIMKLLITKQEKERS